jgi:hypothetical protein
VIPQLLHKSMAFSRFPGNRLDLLIGRCSLTATGNLLTDLAPHFVSTLATDQGWPLASETRLKRTKLGSAKYPGSRIVSATT